MRFELDGAIAMAMRPYGFFGNPLLFSGVISLQVAPLLLERNNPLPEGAWGPSPPDRKVQPLRRKSHKPANITLASFGSITTVEHPVDALGPFRISSQVFPPSFVQ